MKHSTLRRLLCLFLSVLMIVSAGCSVPAYAAAKAKTETGAAETDDTDREDDTCVVDLVAVGDDLLHSPVYTRMKKKNGEYNFDLMFKYIKKDLKKADLSVINQETILVKKDYTSYPRFGSPYAVADAIAKAGFNVVTHATNHTLDRGQENVLGTLKYWRKHHPEITVLGIHNSQKDRDTIKIVEKNGIKIAMLNYTYSLNGRSLPSGKSYLIDMLTSSNRKNIIKDIRQAKKKADFVIVFPHWGTEYKYTASAGQKEWANLFLKEGVDLVIGTHPHVVEPYKMMKDKETGHKMLIYYSLGNFISNQKEVPRMLGGMAKVRIVKDKKGTRIKSYDLEPLVTYLSPGHHKNFTLKLSDFTEELAKKHYLYVKRNKKDMNPAYLKKLFRKIVG